MVTDRHYLVKSEGLILSVYIITRSIISTKENGQIALYFSLRRIYKTLTPHPFISMGHTKLHMLLMLSGLLVELKQSILKLTYNAMKRIAA